MAPSSCIDINVSEQDQLLDIARQSITSGLTDDTPQQLDRESLTGALSVPLGAFVTLKRSQVLRGCMGSMERSDPLAQSVANCAFNAAFRDRRFEALDATEIEDTQIEISVLSEPESIIATDREGLLTQLNSGEDGLLLEDGEFRSTFLPKMWDMISDPEEFLVHLLAKAGLPGDYWSESISFKRYAAVSFGEQELE